jgi:hypothetical protein
MKKLNDTTKMIAIDGGNNDSKYVKQYMYIHICICVYVYMYTYICINIHMYVFIYMYTYMRIYKYTCINIYIYLRDDETEENNYKAITYFKVTGNQVLPLKNPTFYSGIVYVYVC